MACSDLIARECGAHFVHTDYVNGWTSTCGFNSTYTVELRGGSAGSDHGLLASACNPVTASKRCLKRASKKGELFLLYV